MTGIYRIHNLINGKSYVGSSINITKRFFQHQYLLRNNKSHSPILQNAWNKYGEHNLIFEILEECGENVLNEREIYWIRQFNSVSYGYNSSENVNSVWRGRNHTTQTRLRMSEAQKLITRSDERKALSIANLVMASNQRRGNKLTLEHREKIGKANKGKRHSDSTKKKMSLLKLEQSIKPWLGKKRDEKDRKKMSAAALFRYANGYQHPRKKAIEQLDQEGNVIREFPSTIEAAKSLGCETKRTSIKNCLNGRSNCALGFKWRFKSLI